MSSETAHGQLFDAEHRVLDGILADVEALAQRESFSPAAKRFAEFLRFLEQHIANENDVLLPLFLKHSGDPQGVVPLMRAEHAALLRVACELAAALSQWDGGGVRSRLLELTSMLKAHHENEERVLHPALDAIIPNEAAWQEALHGCRHDNAPPMKGSGVHDLSEN
ncbi:MAG: hemerythrin domain-containing protein [Myxococcaceae bacterium]